MICGLNVVLIFAAFTERQSGPCCRTLRCHLSATRLGYTAGRMLPSSATVSRVKDGRCSMLDAASRLGLCTFLHSHKCIGGHDLAHLLAVVVWGIGQADNAGPTVGGTYSYSTAGALPNIEGLLKSNGRMCCFDWTQKWLCPLE